MINTTNIFDYEDIQLIPNKCIVTSRSECDTSVKLGNRTFRLPVVPANMQTIIDEELAENVRQNTHGTSQFLCCQKQSNKHRWLAKDFRGKTRSPSCC